MSNCFKYHSIFYLINYYNFFLFLFICIKTYYMKWCLLLLFFLASSSLFAQEIVRYYNYNWQETIPKYAAYYSKLKKEDSSWLRRDYFASKHKLQMQGYYTDTSCKTAINKFYYFYPDGKLQTQGSYSKGKKDGLWLSYYNNGMMSDSINYNNGQAKGISLQWYRDGSIKDSLNKINDSMAVAVSWFNNRNVCSAGRLLYGKKQGTWAYYDNKGNQKAIIKYSQDSLVSKTYYSETGEIIDTANVHNKDAEFTDGQKGWEKYLYKNLYSPLNVQLVNTDKIVVVVSFDINEEGKLINEAIKTPFHDEYDNIALKTIRNSPKWKPAFKYNRTVTSSFIQAIFFQQIEE